VRDAIYSALLSNSIAWLAYQLLNPLFSEDAFLTEPIDFFRVKSEQAN
jgi:hypothetical protein